MKYDSSQACDRAQQHARFIKAVDSHLMHMNLTLLLFVSILPFSTAIAATHLFASFLTFDDQAAGPGLAERVFLPVIAVVFYLVVSVVSIVEPLRYIRVRARSKPAE